MILLSYVAGMKAMLVVRNIGLSLIIKSKNEFVSQACLINNAILTEKHSEDSLGLISMVKA